MAASASPEVELTRELVALDTVNPGLVPGAPGERAAVDLLAARLQPQGFAVEIAGPPDRPSLLARRQPRTGCGGRLPRGFGHVLARLPEPVSNVPDRRRRAQWMLTPA